MGFLVVGCLVWGLLCLDTKGIYYLQKGVGGGVQVWMTGPDGMGET